MMTKGRYGIHGGQYIPETLMHAVIELEKAYEYYKTKNINIDLIIINEEESSYENYVKDEIEKILFNKGIGYLQNQNGGIFILNNLSKEEIKFLEVRAKLVLDSHKGNLKSQLEDLEEEYLENLKTASYEPKNPTVVEEENEKKDTINMQDLKYYNEYGGFSR